MEVEQQYQSGMGKSSELPPELKGWNWGAFLLNWIWGIGNSTYIALLMFIPIVNLFMIFVLGAKGNKWAWQNRVWHDVEHFKRVQRKWAIAGFIFVFIVLPSIFLLVINLLKGDAYELSLKELSTNGEVVEFLGTPIEPGFFVLGSISKSGSSGSAQLQYSVTGPKDSAEAFVYSVKENDQWVLKQLVVFNEESKKQIVLINEQ